MTQKTQDEDKQNKKK